MACGSGSVWNSFVTMRSPPLWVVTLRVFPNCLCSPDVLQGFLGELTNSLDERAQLLRDRLNTLINRVEQSLRRDLAPFERDYLETARENLVLAREALEEGQLSEADLLMRMAEQELWATL